MTSTERHRLTGHATPPARQGPARPARPPLAITTAAAARRRVRTLVGERWRSPAGPAAEEAVIDLLLVVSELVTNAIRHGGGLAAFDVATPSAHPAHPPDPPAGPPSPR
ncbi:hypothetical protein AB0G86_07510, partial [Streptomyces scabiei]